MKKPSFTFMVDVWLPRATIINEKYIAETLDELNKLIREDHGKEAQVLNLKKSEG